jgi:hypothetical protein
MNPPSEGLDMGKHPVIRPVRPESPSGRFQGRPKKILKD